MQSSAKSLFASLLSGTIFGAGLAVSGMTQPQVVQDFLDPFGHWNPALMFVMAAALMITAIGFRLVFKRANPFWGIGFHLPKARDLDVQLLGGAALFGIGWGLGGYCPGPAFASLSSLNSGVIVFTAAMLIGLFGVNFWRARSVTPHGLSATPAE